MADFDLLLKSLESGSALIMLTAIIYFIRQKNGGNGVKHIEKMYGKILAATAHNEQLLAEKMADLSRQQEKTAVAVERIALATKYEHEAIQKQQEMILQAVQKIDNP